MRHFRFPPCEKQFKVVTKLKKINRTEMRYWLFIFFIRFISFKRVQASFLLYLFGLVGPILIEHHLCYRAFIIPDKFKLYPYFL